MINRILVKSELGCEASCFGDDNCMSVNIGLLEDGKHVCELSSSDHDIHPEDLKDQIDFIYRPVLVSKQRIQRNNYDNYYYYPYHVNYKLSNN